MRQMIILISLVNLAACGQRENTVTTPADPGGGFPFSAKTTAPAATARGHLSLLNAQILTAYHNPALKVYGHDLRIAGAELLKASARQNPQVSFEIEDFFGSGERRYFGAAQATLTLSYTFELGGKRARRREEASASSGVVLMEYRIRRRELLESVTAQYIDVIYLEHQVDIERQMGELDKEILGVFKSKVDGDQLSPLQLARFEVEAGLRRSEREQLGVKLELARRKLAAFWGERQPHFRSMDTCFRRYNVLRPREALERTLPRHPSLKYFRALKTLRAAQLRLARSLKTPDVTISAGVRYYQDNTSGGGVLGVSIPLPLWEVAPGSERVVRYRQDRDAAREGMVARKLASRLSDAYFRLRNCDRQVKAFVGTHLPGARKTYEKIKEGFSLGKLSYLEVLTAKSTVHSIHKKYHEALRDYALASMRVSYLSGQSVAKSSAGSTAHCL